MTPPTATSTLHYRLPLVLWIGVVFAVSSIPGRTLLEVGFDVQDSLAHLIEYAVLGFLGFRMLRAEGMGSAAALLGVVVLGAVVGAADENYQRLIPGRMTTWSDYLADLAGAGVGATVAAMYYRWTGRFDTPERPIGSGASPDGGTEG